MDDRVFDRPVWSSLASVHAPLSIGTQNARRFVSDISPFAAARDESAGSLAELAELIPATGHVVVVQADDIICPAGIRVVSKTAVVQMFLGAFDIRRDRSCTIERLGDADAPAMLALALLTKPGPFAARTHVLGEFWGVKRNGQLVAMAGERLKQPGFTELSGVCTHPDFQGRGFGRALCLTVLERIIARGERSYLHVYSTNTGAIGLYEKLGFSIRRELHVCQLERI